MQLNHEILSREMEAQRWSTTALAEELVERGADLTRSHLSNIKNGHRSCPPEVLRLLAEVLNVNPYALLGPEDPKVAVAELVKLYELTPADLEALGGDRHPPEQRTLEGVAS